MKLLTSKEFLIGVAVTVALVKFGDRLPVVGQFVAKLK
jgi:hypothetical protein